MTLPSLILGLIIPIGIGAAFHLWKKGGASRLLVFLFASEFGFWLGHAMAGVLNIRLFEIGTLNIYPALIGSLALLFFTHWLFSTNPGQVK